MKKGIPTTYFIIIIVILLIPMSNFFQTVSNFFRPSGSPSANSGRSTKVIVMFSSPSLSEDPRFSRMSQELKVRTREANIRAANGEKASVTGPKSIEEMIRSDPEFSRKLANLEREHREFERALPNGWRIATVQRENGQSQPAESFIMSNTATGK